MGMTTTESHMMSVLLVDDDAPFRMVTRRSLEDRGLKVYDAANGREAVAILGVANIDLVISDIRMPVMHGIELLQYIRSKIPGMPVMMMSGFADIIELNAAFELGMTSYLSKPFKIDELEKNLSEIFEIDHPLTPDFAREQQLKHKKECEITDFKKISIDEFSSGANFDFPVYLKLSESKIVKVANRGEDLSHDMIFRFKRKGIDHLYFSRKDCNESLRLMTTMSVEKTRMVNVDVGRRTKIYSNTIKHILKVSSDGDFDNEVTELIKQNIEQIVEIFMDDETSFNVLEQLTTKAEDLYEHSIQVCFVATTLAKNMGWTSAQKLFLVTAAGIFHDIGMLELDRKLWFRPHHDFDQQENKIYQSHPQKGADIVSKMKGFPEGMAQIILQHHECADGTGFPKGIGRVNTHPVAKMINVSDAFCHEWNERGAGELKIGAKKALKNLQMRRHLYDDQFLSTLQKSLRIR